MEVYIDNQKTNFGRRTKDLEKILKAISKKLEKNNKVIENIYINGSSIEEFPFIDMDMKNVMEVTTKSYVDLSLESLNLSKEYIEIFFDINNGFQENIIEKEEISAIEIEETDVFLNWFSDLLYFLITNYSFTFPELEEIFETFKGELAILSEFKEKKDYIAYVSTLNYCVSDILETFVANIDYYQNCILNDEAQKKNLF
ncbi:MAG: chemotaxis protein [Fusobacterium periodonticum]|nr:chemotaxis protein [Fusobacterium periodonticum]